MVGGRKETLTINEIERCEDGMGCSYYLIYGKNDYNESALWKEVRGTNIEVEYDIKSILIQE
jgi:hypothetical protein